MASKIEPRLAGLRKLKHGKEFKLPKHLALLTYKAYVRPVIEYGCEAFIPLHSNRLEKLQKFQNRALRTCLGRDIYTRIADLHSESQISRVEERLRARSLKFVVRAINNNTLVGRELLEEYRTDLIPSTRPSIVSPMDILRPLLTPSTG